MILFLNGAFGIGKTTVARALARRLARSVLFDPEKIGGPLQYIARLGGRPVDDFQDLRSWRTLTGIGLRLARLTSPNVIVPMSITNLAYLDELRAGVARFEPVVAHVCLVAPLAVVQERLRMRGADPRRHHWEYRRAAECCLAHGQRAFAKQVDASERTPDQLAEDVLALVPLARGRVS